MLKHDFVTPLGHDRQFRARLIRPHAKAKKAEADKKDADNLSKAQDRAAENFKRNQARGKTTATAKAPVAAAPAAGAAPAAAAAPAAKK
jgi:hypothetical protein